MDRLAMQISLNQKVKGKLELGSEFKTRKVNLKL